MMRQAIIIATLLALPISSFAREFELDSGEADLIPSDGAIVSAASGSTCGGAFAVTKGSAIGVGRASTEIYFCEATGVAGTASSNTLGCTEKGCQIFAASQNIATQSQTIVSGTALVSPWDAYTNGTAALSYDDNAGNAPDGTATADQVNFPATDNPADYAAIYDGVWSVSAGVRTTSIFLKGVSASGTIYSSHVEGSPTWGTTACTFNATTWTRCSVTGTLASNDYWNSIGVDRRDAAQSDQPAQSILLWGEQHEVGPVVTPYVPTVTVPVARNATVVTKVFDIGTTPTAFTITTTVAAQWGTIVGLWELGPSGSGNHFAAYVTAGKVLTVVVSDTNPTTKTWTSSALTMVAGTSYEIAIGYNPTTNTVTAAQNGVAKTMTGVGSGVAPTSYPETAYIGFDGTNYLQGYLSEYFECSGTNLGLCT